MDPRTVRPRDGWCVVLADQRKQKLDSGILLPLNETGVEKVTEGSGIIIRCGPGEKNPKMGLEAGQKIVYRSFLRWANRVDCDEEWPNGELKHYFIMSSLDIIALVPPEVEVGIFSGRPQIPEMKETTNG